MRYTVPWLLASAGWASALTQQCSGKAVDEGGNWFCGKTHHILYEGLMGKGSFKAVTAMGSDGVCEFEEKPYSGPLAPLDEDLSIHIRGPFQLKEAAVYTLAPNKNHGMDASPRARSRFRQRHRHAPHKRADMVVATINGKVVSWENNWFGPPTKTPPPATAPTRPPVAAAPAAPPRPPPGTASASHAAETSHAAENTPAASGPRTNASPPTKPGPSGSEWDRIAYYSAEKQLVENMVFMGNYGGQGSGVFDYVWGNSLSYLNADGNGGSDSPKPLKDVLLPSNKEFAIFSAEKCDESCGFSRTPDIAYKGFGGANKVFLFHFRMPLDGDRGFNGDMPALWALNARIPRSAQYSSCSCWTTGCGEADFLEVLAKGDTKCKSTFHLANGAGSSDWFERPVDTFVKIAVVFDEATASVSIQRLSDDTVFSDGLDADTVRSWIRGPKDKKMSSLFQVAG